MVSLEISLRAQRDLNNILRYSARMWGPEQAETYVDGLRTVFQRLESFPELGQALGRRRIRRLVHQKHVLFYRFDSDQVTVLRVVSIRAALPLGLEAGRTTDEGAS